MENRLVPVLLIFVLLGLGGCTGVGAATGAGANVGLAAAEERGIAGAARDLRIKADVLDLFFRYEHTLPVKVGTEVYGSRVLLTGIVSDPNIQTEAVRLAWTVEGVEEVLNEILVGKDGGVTELAYDSWITAQLKSRVTIDKKILAINYIIETVAGTIYMIGMAQDQAELDRVMAYARAIPHVRHIINHVRIKKRP